MWGHIPRPPKPSKSQGYELVWLCDQCAEKRARKGAHRAEETLLPREYRYCKDCVEVHTCGGFRDYGKD